MSDISKTAAIERPKLPPIPDACSWDKFREDAHKTIDFIVDYNKSMLNREIPCHSPVKPGFLVPALGGNASSPSAPETAQPWEETLRQIQSGVVPGMLHWQHPDFLAYFPAQASPPALLGDLVASAMNQPGFSWACSPAATEMELLVMDWVVEMLGFSKETFSFKHGSGGSCLHSTATDAAVVAMLAAKANYLRKNQVGPEVVPKMVVYVSDQAHFCVEKASKVLGLCNFRKVPTLVSDTPFRGNRGMCLESLEKLIKEDIANGFAPLVVSGNFGATGMCAVDDLAGIQRVAHQYGLWFNVDAAYAGVVGMLPEMRTLTAPLNLADSMFINASKWMNCLFNSSLFFFRDRAAVAASLNATGVYLDNKQTAAGTVVDLKDYQVGLGRPFRSLKLFTTFQTFGLEGLRGTLRRHISLAGYLLKCLQMRSAELNSELPPFIFPVEPIFGLVCAAFNPVAYPNHKYADFMKFIELVNETKKIFIVHTTLTAPLNDPTAKELFLVRFSLSHATLDFADMDRIVHIIFEELAVFNKIDVSSTATA